MQNSVITLQFLISVMLCYFDILKGGFIHYLIGSLMEGLCLYVEFGVYVLRIMEKLEIPSNSKVVLFTFCVLLTGLLTLLASPTFRNGFV